MKRAKFQREVLALLREQNATLRRIAAVVERNSKTDANFVELAERYPGILEPLGGGRQ